MKIALVENFGADFLGARLRLAIYLQNQGFIITAIIPKDGHREIIESKGIRVIEVGANIRAKGIRVKLNFAKQLKLILKEENFDIVHFFRLQPNIIGTFVAGLFTSSKIVNHVTGLGVAFTSKSLKNRILQSLIRFFYKTNHFFFRPYIVYQNNQDAFDLGIHKRAICIYGSAVNETRFELSKVLSNKPILEKLKSDLKIETDTRVFLFVSRLLKEKGVLELIKAFRNIEKEVHKPIKLLIVGWSDPENPSAVKTNELKELIKDIDSISFLGKRSDIEFLLGISQVSILPTYYREGTPRFLLESMLMNNAIITTNMPGCNHLIFNDENGILIEPKNKKALENSIKNILKKNIKIMGKKSNKLYHQKFSEKVVYSEIENLYKSILQL